MNLWRPVVFGWVAQLTGVIAIAVACLPPALAADPPAKSPRRQNFDTDPKWDGLNNRIGAEREAVKVKQDFGFSATRRAGGKDAGEIGGFVTPAAEPAFYASALQDRLSFDSPLSASGKLSVPKGGGNTLVGFFNRGSLNEWRTPSTFLMRVNARGDEGFHVHVEYCTSRWRAGADFFGAVNAASGKKQAMLFAPDVSHTWSLRYDPAGNDGGGAIRATIDGEELAFNLDPGHRSDGAAFDRFGVLNVLKSYDGGGEIWLDDLDVNGSQHTFDADPKWDALDNRRQYATRNVRPWFNFGYSETHFASGARKGEIGGLLFRGDRRYPDRLAHYGDALADLSLDDALEAGGRVCLRRGVTDSTVLIGFYHATHSLRVLDSQKSGFPENFLGVAIEGPSRDGFFFYPVYSAAEEGTGNYAKSSDGPPHILPDGASHEWTLHYNPSGGADGQGQITVTLDGKSVALDVGEEHRRLGARFNRFGFVTTHIDGNGQEVFLDDLTYTAAPAKR